VLKDHVQASGSGACYNNFAEFKDGLTRLLSLREREKTAAKSVSYIAANYN